MDFEKKTLASFANIRDEADQFRDSMNDWIVFLNHELKEARNEISELRKKLSELELQRFTRY